MPHQGIGSIRLFCPRRRGFIHLPEYMCRRVGRYKSRAIGPHGIQIIVGPFLRWQFVHALQAIVRLVPHSGFREARQQFCRHSRELFAAAVTLYHFQGSLEISHRLGRVSGMIRCRPHVHEIDGVHRPRPYGQFQPLPCHFLCSLPVQLYCVHFSHLRIGTLQYLQLHPCSAFPYRDSLQETLHRLRVVFQFKAHASQIVLAFHFLRRRTELLKVAAQHDDKVVTVEAEVRLIPQPYLRQFIDTLQMHDSRGHHAFPQRVQCLQSRLRHRIPLCLYTKDARVERLVRLTPMVA